MELNDGGAVDNNPSGVAMNENENENLNLQATDKKSDLVSWDTHKRLLAQRKKDQEELRQLREFQAQKQSEAQELEQQQQAARGEFDKVLSSYKQKVETLETQIKNTEQEKLRSMKYQAVVDSLPGRLAKPEYVAFIDVNEIFIDPQNGLIDENSIKEAADKFLKEHPSLLVAEKNIPRLPNEMPRDQAPKPQGPQDYDEAKFNLKQGLSAILPGLQNQVAGSED